MNPNYSSNLFRYFYFSRGCWGSISFPMVTLYRPLLCKNICISSLQSIQLKGVRILGVKVVEWSIFQLQETTDSLENVQLTCKKTSIHNKTNSNTLHFNMCTFSRCITPGQTSLEKIQREQGKNTRNYVEPKCFGCINRSFQGLKLA